MTSAPKFVGIAGLPRSGSTLMCQLLAQNPSIYCEGASSPLANTLIAMRRTISKDQFFLSQLDKSFDRVYNHLQTAMVGFVRGWYTDVKHPVLVDKCRTWLHCTDLLLRLIPDAKLIICIRELGQIFGSVEAQHQKTVLIDFIDGLSDQDVLTRSDTLFQRDRVIGQSVNALSAIEDMPAHMRERLFVVKFEDLMAFPQHIMGQVYDFIGAERHEIDLSNLKLLDGESDSHYHMKFPHKTKPYVQAPSAHLIPPRIQAKIKQNYQWFYQRYYNV
jgi:sulfotransferase